MYEAPTIPLYTAASIASAVLLPWGFRVSEREIHEALARAWMNAPYV